MDDFNDINEALGRNYATPDYLDEADLDAELGTCFLSLVHFNSSIRCDVFILSPETLRSVIAQCCVYALAHFSTLPPFFLPDFFPTANLPFSIEMLGDELEEELAEEAEADATPSYLLPATPNMPAPGSQEPAEQVDEYGLPTAPIGNQ